MKKISFIVFVLCSACMMRVEWDNLDKPTRNYAYKHPHDGNLTKSEKVNGTKPSSASNGMYKIKTQEELNKDIPSNCITKTAKCMSECNLEHDINSSYFALTVAYIQAKRGMCYDKCYNEISPGCDYPLKRIKY